MSEFKKSIVTNALHQGETFKNDYGTFYVHNINFANGDFGTYNSKEANQQKFIVGQEVDYEINKDNPSYPAKIKPYNPEYAQGQPTVSTMQTSSVPNQNPTTKPANNTQRSIEKQVALKLATETIDINNGGMNKLLETADVFDNWLQGFARENGLKAPAPVVTDEGLPENPPF